jgi:hypothetical protein
MSLVAEAAADLYGADPGAFVARRKELAAAARKAGDAAAAKQIAALAKPTRSAWLINQLVRADPGVPGRLAELASQLQEMPALDAAAIRQLTVARRQLVDSLVRDAIKESDGPAPSGALRDEIADTFNAALADPQVADQLEAGTLVKAAHWAGFGFGFGSGPPAGPATAPATRSGTAPDGKPPAKQPARRAAAGPDQKERAARQALEEAKAAAEAAVDAEKDRREAVQIVEAQFAEAKEKVAQGDRAVVAARQALAEAQRALELAERQNSQASERHAKIRQQLSKARQDLKDAGAAGRQTAGAQTRAQQALDRLASSPSES